MTVWLFYDFVATGEPKINCPVVQIVKPLAKGPQKLIISCLFTNTQKLAF